MSQGFRSPSSGSLSGDVVQQVDAKVPALLFKQQLTAYVETIYGIVQENVKRELEPVLLSCIQVNPYKKKKIILLSFQYRRCFR